MVRPAGVRTSLVVLEQIYVRGAVAGVPGPGAGAPRRGALRHAGPGDPGGRRVGAPAAGAGTRERRASRGQGGEGPRSAGARRRARAASAPRPLLEPARGAAATGARRPTGQAAPARADVATPGRRSRRRGDLSSRHPRPVDGSLEASTAGKNASAHSAQALGLADFKNAFSTPLSSRGGPAARPLSARSARSQASSEHRTSRSDDRRPREGHATARPPARVARRRRLGSDAAKDVARVQGCRRAPAKTVRAGTAAATGAAADARGAIDVRSRQNRAVPTSGAPWATDPSCLPYVVRGAVRVRARARAAGDRRGATAAANGDAGRARARPGRVHAPGVPRGRSPRRRRSAATFRASADGRGAGGIRACARRCRRKI